MKPLEAALIVILGAPTLAGAEAPPGVSLAWRLVTPVRPEVLARAEPEVAAIFRRAGLAVSWSAPEDALTPGVLPVVVLASAPSSRLPRRLLGVASPDRGAGVWIYYPSIKAELGVGHAAEEALAAAQVRRLGRALGRVVAHEVVHAYQAPHAHSRAGLMRPHFDARLLTDDGLDWDLDSQTDFVRALTEGEGTARREVRGGAR